MNQHSQKTETENLLDVQDALEHIVAIGSKIRHDGWRLSEWKLRHERELLLRHRQHHLSPDENDDNNEEDKGQKEPEEGEGPREEEKQQEQEQEQEQPLLHAEDIRIYGTNGNPKEPWPKRRRRAGGRRTACNDTDEEWNIEHGDTIHPLSFCLAKLTQQQQHVLSPPSLDEDPNYANTHNRMMINGNNLHVATTITTVSQEQVPRALVLKCWERAVHAASCTVLAPVPVAKAPDDKQDDAHHHHEPIQEIGTDTDTTTVNPMAFTSPQPVRRTNPPSGITDQQEFSSAAALAKCKSWHIELPSAAGSGTSNIDATAPSRRHCPSCGLECETFQQLHTHYYGDDSRRQKGCCWILLRSKQRSMMDQVLQRHVESQADQLLQVLLAKANQYNNNHSKNSDDNASLKPDSSSSNKTMNDRKRQRRLLNWHDVFQFAQATLDSSSPHLENGTVDEMGQSPSTARGIRTHNPVWETLQVERGKTSLVLNRLVMDAVQRRLIDRYADVPF